MVPAKTAPRSRTRSLPVAQQADAMFVRPFRSFATVCVDVDRFLFRSHLPKRLQAGRRPMPAKNVRTALFEGGHRFGTVIRRRIGHSLLTFALLGMAWIDYIRTRQTKTQGRLGWAWGCCFDASFGDLCIVHTVVHAKPSTCPPSSADVCVRSTLRRMSQACLQSSSIRLRPLTVSKSLVSQAREPSSACRSQGLCRSGRRSRRHRSCRSVCVRVSKTTGEHTEASAPDASRPSPGIERIVHSFAVPSEHSRWLQAERQQDLESIGKRYLQNSMMSIRAGFFSTSGRFSAAARF